MASGAQPGLAFAAPPLAAPMPPAALPAALPAMAPACSMASFSGPLQSLGLLRGSACGAGAVSAPALGLAPAASAGVPWAPGAQLALAQPAASAAAPPPPGFEPTPAPAAALVQAQLLLRCRAELELQRAALGQRQADIELQLAALGDGGACGANGAPAAALRLAADIGFRAQPGGQSALQLPPPAFGCGGSDGALSGELHEFRSPSSMSQASEVHLDLEAPPPPFGALPHHAALLMQPPAALAHAAPCAPQLLRGGGAARLHPHVQALRAAGAVFPQELLASFALPRTAQMLSGPMGGDNRASEVMLLPPVLAGVAPNPSAALAAALDAQQLPLPWLGL